MCGRYTQTAAFDELAQGFATLLENAGPEGLTARSNQFPSQNVPIIVVSKGVQQLVLVIILCTGISLGACAQMPPTTMQGSHEIEGRIDSEVRPRMARVPSSAPVSDHGGLEANEANGGRELVVTDSSSSHGRSGWLLVAGAAHR